MAVVIRKEEIDKSLASEPTKGKKLLEPLKSLAQEKGLPIKILEDMEITNEAEVHEKEGDLWQCLEGEVTFVCGGKLANPQKHPRHDFEWKGTGVEGGEEIILKPGDWLWIPAGEPHQHNCPDGVARMVIIKVPAKK